MAQDYKEARRRIGVDLWKSTLNCIVRGGKHWFSSSFFILLCNVLMACFHYSNCFWLVLLLLLLFVCGKCPFIMVQWVGVRRYKVSKNFLPSQHWTHTHYIFIHIYCKLRWKVVAVMCAGGCVLQYVCIEDSFSDSYPNNGRQFAELRGRCARVGRWLIWKLSNM